jgi:hypothetical protein
MDTPAALNESQWAEILGALSLGDINDRPRFIASDESYHLSRHDCRKLAAQLVQHFTAPSPKGHPMPEPTPAPEVGRSPR